MKTVIKMALAGLATVLFATGGSAIANDSKQVVVEEHHGSSTYTQQTTQWQRPTTVGVYVQGRWERVRHFSTGQGTVSYFAPAR
ncbi:MAG TPA: hypothetical protein VGM54_03970 [Chthoniobacter sp.]|jgi:hypothetical protein